LVLNRVAGKTTSNPEGVGAIDGPTLRVGVREACHGYRPVGADRERREDVDRIGRASAIAGGAKAIEYPWRWGDSNPRPRTTDQGFSGRSRW